ncbi:hypothetical protein [Qingshengfaniella alkalisoli]|uniref:DnaA N-terminal domain-containing protein n=1 Tax=Qingshengfaniella alkalisoli TaxID=2599296 RepID=A0A5B8IXW0_9RHOB|nr:hypothetical protein [Qingshengfaniella alkalisoli]QDY71002.1 hypothetical protein FPZ52_15030 [Qingshengfaniella alkalisoli]
MLQPKATGRFAAARKYDLLTAMGAYALGQGKGPQQLTLRLMTLVTARYNWSRNELAVGQREIARLWNVNERTVKREMAKLRGMGWIRLKRAAVRGRVAEYGLEIDQILQDTRDHWRAVGPDFELRMGHEPTETVVPLPVKGQVTAPDCSDGTEWSLAKAVLHSEDPALYAAWGQALSRDGRAGGRLTLRAPSRFHAAWVEQHLKDRLTRICRQIDPDVSEVVILV